MQRNAEKEQPGRCRETNKTDETWPERKRKMQGNNQVDVEKHRQRSNQVDMEKESRCREAQKKKQCLQQNKHGR